MDEYEIYPDSGIYWQNGVDTAQTASDNPIDDTAFFYFVRTVDLVPGDSLAFYNYFRPDRNPVIVKVIARDTIDVPAGRDRFCRRQVTLFDRRARPLAVMDPTVARRDRFLVLPGVETYQSGRCAPSTGEGVGPDDRKE